MLNLFSGVVSEEDNSHLCSIPTEVEVIQALASLGFSKASRPDGFTALFYKKYWSIVRTDVLQFIWNFFRFHHLPRKQNHTFLALIPKVNGSHLAHQFKPISLCNIAYKIISKLLANRLKPLLHKIISPTQAAFIPNRNIQDNTILAHELLHSFNNKKGKGGFLFLKMDRRRPLIEWNRDFCWSSWKSLVFAPLGLHGLEPASLLPLSPFC
jgi:hypothetical protein